jgi:uncharacterized cupredoxin-like copper-binding protein
MTRRLAAAVVLLVLTVAFGACGDDGDHDDADGREVRITAGASDELRFDLPAEVPAGATRFSLANEGGQAHHAQVLRLAEGTDVGDVETALAEGGPPAVLDVGTFDGGTGLVTPGETSQADAVLDLEPGAYVLLCFVPDADGVPHAAQGMLRPFQVVTGSSPPDDADDPPDTDADVELVDYRFDLPPRIDGSSDLGVSNGSSSEPHELLVTRLDEGATVDDVTDALDDRRPMPAVGLGGMQAILPGASERLRLDLAPGRYVVLCAIPSPDGTPHYRAGMVEEVTVT